MFGFTFQDVAREFPQKNRVHLARILADIVDKGMLCKITRDNYHIIPFNADPETYLPDGHQTEPDHRRIRRKFGLKFNVDPICIKWIPSPLRRKSFIEKCLGVLTSDSRIGKESGIPGDTITATALISDL